MSRKLTQLSMVLGASGVIAASVATAAYAATSANAAVVHAPAWHTILSLPGGKTPSNTVETVVATGRTSGWAFPASSAAAYERTGSTTWKQVVLPDRGGTVNVAGLFPAKTPGEYTSPVLTGITAPASNIVYAIGDGPLGPHIGNGVILHYNGHAWSRVGVGGFISSAGQQVTQDGTGGLWIPAQNPEGPNRLFHYSAGQVTLLFLPGSTGLPTSSNSVSRIPGTAEVISGGTAFNATNSAANRPVVLQYS